MHPDGALAVNSNSETVCIELAKQLFNHWIAGVLLAAILAAVMSILSCQLLVCSSALTEDIDHTFMRKNAGHKELVWKQFNWLGLYEIVPGFLFAWLATVLVSRQGQPSSTMLSTHEAVELEFSRL